MHRSRYVSMAHCPHDGSQIPEGQLAAGLSKQAIYGAQVTQSRTPERKHPALGPCAAPCTQKLEDATAHRNKSSPLPESCCPAQRSRDFPNRDSRCACGRVPVGFSSRYLASRSRCRGRVQRFASATCRPQLLRAISFPLHRQAEDAAHAPSSV